MNSVTSGQIISQKWPKNETFFKVNLLCLLFMQLFFKKLGYFLFQHLVKLAMNKTSPQRTHPLPTTYYLVQLDLRNSRFRKVFLHQFLNPTAITMMDVADSIQMLICPPPQMTSTSTRTGIRYHEWVSSFEQIKRREFFLQSDLNRFATVWPNLVKLLLWLNLTNGDIFLGLYTNY